MNVLEKAQLIQELHALIDGLEHRSLSFYQIAYSKARLHEIFNLCDEPIFKKQILKFKARTQPEQAAHDFADHTLYRQAFQGVFQHTNLLEEALSAYPDSGWGILYHPATGWQIWLMTASKGIAITSQWGDLDDIYPWLLEQQSIYHCLKTDVQLKQPLMNIEAVFQPTETETETETDLNLSIQTTQEKSEHVHSSQIQQSVSLSDLSKKSQPIDLTTFQQQADSDTAIESHPIVHSLTPNSTEIPITAISQDSSNQNAVSQTFAKQISLNEYLADLNPMMNQDFSPVDLYVMNIVGLPDLSRHLDLLFYSSSLNLWQQQPIYLAEQLSKQGQFIKYLALLGADDSTQAAQLMHRFTAQNQQYISAIKTISWDNLQTNLTDIERLFYCYRQQSDFSWHMENYQAFIPNSLFQTQKFIQFEESPADIQTPLLLLKEKQKIRLIHGKNRLNLSLQESAYPYLLLDRQQGITWQRIQSVINQLNSPIHVTQLYDAIQKNITH